LWHLLFVVTSKLSIIAHDSQLVGVDKLAFNVLAIVYVENWNWPVDVYHWH